MAVDIFLKIDGIKGESKDEKHPNEIDVLSWSWGLNQSGSFHMGSGGGTGKVNVHDFNFTHYSDAATTDLMKACANGKHLKNAALVVRKAGENPLEYMKITMDDVLVSSVQAGGSHGDERQQESVSLNFAKVKVEYATQTAKGGSGTTGTMTWDIPGNKP
jgi:type VI secretion system secreted protein Hcp